MLLLGALFALFMMGFWLYCLVDVALTPGRECRGLPKAAWIAVVGGTFIIGAAMWLAVRRPAQPVVSSGPPGHDPAGPSLPHAPQARGGVLRRNRRPGARARSGNDPARGGPGTDGPHGGSGPDGSRGGSGADSPRGGSGAGDPGGGEGAVRPGHPAAEAAVLRHPAGQSRPRGAGRSHPKGPDDDPEFLRSLNRAIHGAETGDDPAGWSGEEG